MTRRAHQSFRHPASHSSYPDLAIAGLKVAKPASFSTTPHLSTALSDDMLAAAVDLLVVELGKPGSAGPY